MYHRTWRSRQYRRGRGGSGPGARRVGRELRLERADVGGESVEELRIRRRTARQRLDERLGTRRANSQRLETERRTRARHAMCEVPDLGERAHVARARLLEIGAHGAEVTLRPFDEFRRELGHPGPGGG